MQAILFLITRQLKNRIKRTFSSVLSIIITLLVLVGFGFSFVTAFMIKRPALPAESVETILAGAVLIIGVLIYNTFLSRDSGILTMADATFLFTGPFEKRTVLAYLLISTAPVSVITGFFMCFYVPMLLGSALTLPKFLVVLLVISLLFGGIYLSYYYLYILDAEKQGLKKRVRLIFLAILGVLALTFAAVVVQNNFNIQKSARIFFTHPLYNWLPLFGWTKWAISSILTGNLLYGFLPSAALMVITNLLLSVALYNVKADFYEKTLEDSVSLQKMMDEIKSSGSADARSLYKLKNKIAQVRFKQGAAAIYSRQVLESKKFGIFSNYREVLMGVFYIAVGAIFGLDFSFVIAMIGFGALSMSLNDSWHRDFKKPYLFLIPASSFQKVIFSVLPGIFKSMISGSISLIIAAVVYKISPVNLVAYIIIFASFVVLFILAEVHSYRIVGSGANAMVIMFMRMFFAMATMIPSIVVLVIVMTVTQSELNILLIAVLMLLLNFAASTILAFLSRGIFEKSELMD